MYEKEYDEMYEKIDDDIIIGLEGKMKGNEELLKRPFKK